MRFESPKLFRPYYHGPYKWDDYLLDTQQTIRKSTDAQTEAVLESLGVLEKSLEEMRADFTWGLTLIADRLAEQTDLIRRVTVQLDAIQKTLESPLLTQARELFRLGQDRLEQGLLDKALEAFLQAEKKNDVDFLLQLQLGKLYLYGRDEDDNVVHLSEAERHLLLAARYAKGHQRSLPDWYSLCGQAYFHAAVAAYLQGNEEQQGGKPEAAQICLGRGLEHVATAIDVWPAFAESFYLRAKIFGVLGNATKAIEQLMNAIDRDRRYIAKSRYDQDFEALRTQVASLPERVQREPGPIVCETRRRLNAATDALALAKKAKPEGNDLIMLKAMEDQVRLAGAKIDEMDTDIQDLLERVEEVRHSLLTLADQVLRERIKALEGQVTVDQNRINEIERSKKKDSGSGLGCFLAVLAFFGTIGIGVALMAAKVLPTSIPIFYPSLGTAALAFVLGRLASYPRLNLEIRELRRQISDRSPQIALWRNLNAQVIELMARAEVKATSSAPRVGLTAKWNK